jgi:two-component system, NtrC family, response regulator AtoC
MAIEKILIQTETKFFSPHREIIWVKNGAAALQSLKETPFDLIIVEELETLRLAQALLPKALIVIVSPLPSIAQAVEAIKLGAFDYFSHPLTPDLLESIVAKAEKIPSKPQPSLSGKRETILAESSIMQQVLTDISKVASSHASVFICGESGTGKEVVAHAIHYQSSRSRQPFIKVNCAAIPETLIESEFFGHKKGSFTGAIEERVGRFELAHKGTLLLDEISEIPLAVQAKLLRVVQEQEFERVGGNRSIKVDVRLISTSNRNMKQMIEQKQFREDLYFRLNVVPLFLPPLRERKEDIPALADYFLERFSEENQKRKIPFSAAALQALLNYPWPGNIRELANIIERAIVMSSGKLIDISDLRLDPAAPPLFALPLAKPTTLAEREKQHILETLTACGHNRTQAANVLGISIKTLRNKLSCYF